jgi:hypothetical protein
MKEKLLLHTCCAICTSKLIEELQTNFEVIGHFYNPNIEPPGEYWKRVEAIKELSNHCQFQLILDNYDNSMWHEEVAGLEHWAEGGKRCWHCYELRLEATAYKAQTMDIPNFSTTLTVSRYKNANIINQQGNRIGEKFRVKFVELVKGEEDKKKYNYELAKKLNLYRQKYCGCVYAAQI